MRPITERHSQPAAQPGSLAQRLAWFAGLWLASLAVVAALAYGMRALLLL
jgi:hypothetical protein